VVAACGAPAPETGQARWIWSQQPQRNAAPGAFYAVRDFELDTVPESAELLITADEEYRVFLNGRPLGSGRRPVGSAMDLDRYAVAPFLLQGGNRLLVELRHSWGQGGLLLLLRDGNGGVQVASDSAWRVVRGTYPGLLEGWAPSEKGEPVRVWGRPPVGRWGTPRALLDGLPAPAAASRGPRTTTLSETPEVRAFDWGQRVCGYLQLTFGAEETQVLAVLYLGDTTAALPPEARNAIPLPVLRLPESDVWWSAAPYCFRHARLYGTVAEAALAPVAPERAHPLPTPAPGLLGIAPPSRRDPVLFAVRQRLRGTLDGLEIGADPAQP
jgi:hypothetical protein